MNKFDKLYESIIGEGIGGYYSSGSLNSAKKCLKALESKVKELSKISKNEDIEESLHDLLSATDEFMPVEVGYIDDIVEIINNKKLDKKVLLPLIREVKSLAVKYNKAIDKYDDSANEA